MLAVLILILIGIIVIFATRKGCSKKDYAICRVHAEESTLKLKVAYSSEAQEHGLMGVSALLDDTGMIFVYEKPENLSFWMKNTLIPLSIAFVESDG